MNRAGLALAALLLAPPGAAAAGAPLGQALALQEAFSAAASSAAAAVVAVAAVQDGHASPAEEFLFWGSEEFLEQSVYAGGGAAPGAAPRGRRVPVSGSGFVVHPDGYILTSEHVVRGTTEVSVIFPGEPARNLAGRVISRDAAADLAVIKVAAGRVLPVVSLGDSDGVRAGQWSIALGSPAGLEQAVTVGVISAPRQKISIGKKVYRGAIQTDAAINPGNSGGPLLNIRGEVIGVNMAGYAPGGEYAGIGFAIPVNRAKELLARARDGAPRGWIGAVTEDDLDAAAAAVYGLPDARGAMLLRVLPGQPADKAGLLRGDVIREFDGKLIDNNAGLLAAVAAAAPGKKVKVRLIRRRARVTAEIAVRAAPDAAGEPGLNELDREAAF
ncbi:MAG: S1C family serine protease [Elusimicrobiales bacterium]